MKNIWEGCNCQGWGDLLRVILHWERRGLGQGWSMRGMTKIGYIWERCRSWNQQDLVIGHMWEEGEVEERVKDTFQFLAWVLIYCSITNHKESKRSILGSTLVLVEKKQSCTAGTTRKEGITKIFPNGDNTKSQRLCLWTTCFIFFSYSFPVCAPLNSLHNLQWFPSKLLPPSACASNSISSAKWVLVSPQTNPLSFRAFLAFAAYSCWHCSSLQTCFIRPTWL